MNSMHQLNCDESLSVVHLFGPRIPRVIPWHQYPSPIRHSQVMASKFCSHKWIFVGITTMGWIVPRLMNFVEGPINKSNVALELWKLCHQNPSLLNSGPMNFIGNGRIDAKWNKYAIIVYCTLAPIPHEGIIFNHISCFMNTMKLNKCYFKANLDGCPIMRCGSPMDLAWLIMIGTTSCANSSNFPKIELVTNLNKLNVAYMVIRMSCFSFDSNDVKYSQVLT